MTEEKPEPTPQPDMISGPDPEDRLVPAPSPDAEAIAKTAPPRDPEIEARVREEIRPLIAERDALANAVECWKILRRQSFKTAARYERERDAALDDLFQTSGDLCPECGWRGVRGGECEFCALHIARAERDAALQRTEEWAELLGSMLRPPIGDLQEIVQGMEARCRRDEEHDHGLLRRLGTILEALSSAHEVAVSDEKPDPRTRAFVPLHVAVHKARGGCAPQEVGKLPCCQPHKVMAFVCGPPGCDCDNKGEQVSLYGPDGKPCGASTSCSKCGTSAFERDIWRLQSE